MMKNILTGHLHNSHWCFGILETGAEHVLANVHYLNDYNRLHHIDYDLDSEHRQIGDKPQFNNYFISVIKNLGAHLFMNCEAGSLYPHRALLEEARITTCFNDYHDLMVAARIGKEGYIRQIAGYNTNEDDTRIRYVSWAIFEIPWGKTKHRDTQIEEPLTRARMKMTRVCIPRRTEACRRFTRYHRGVHSLHGFWVRPLSGWRDRRRRGQSMLSCNSENWRFPRTNAAYCSTGSTRWWMLQHKQDANTLERFHLLGSSTLSPVVIESLIFLQHIWMALQQIHTPPNSWRRH